MILESLVKYYETMTAQGRIPEFGWEDHCKVRYGLNIDGSGEITALIPYQTTVMRKGKKGEGS